MTEASQHDKAVEQFVVAKILPVEFPQNRKLQGVNDTTDGIYNAADQKPQKRFVRHLFQNGRKSEYH